MNSKKVNLKAIINKVFYLPPWLILLFLIISVAGLGYVFLYDKKYEELAYVVYVLSAYSLTVLIIAIVRFLNPAISNIKKLKPVKVYLTDEKVNIGASLIVSLFLNMAYALFEAFSGYYYHSAWYGTLAFYYIVLTIVRGRLMYAILKKKGNDWVRYRNTGWILLLFTIVILGMSILMQNRLEDIQYPGHLIFAVALYTFFSVGNGIRNIVKYKKNENPNYRASKIVTFSTALVSVYILQSAMLTRFGGSDSVQFIKDMNMITGLAVFFITIGISCYVIWNGSREIRKNRVKL